MVSGLFPCFAPAVPSSECPVVPLLGCGWPHLSPSSPAYHSSGPPTPSCHTDAPTDTLWSPHMVPPQALASFPSSPQVSDQRGLPYVCPDSQAQEMSPSSIRPRAIIHGNISLGKVVFTRLCSLSYWGDVCSLNAQCRAWHASRAG